VAGARGEPPLALLGARVLDPASGHDGPGGVLVEEGEVRAAGRDVVSANLPAAAERVDLRGAVVAPGLVDMRVFTGEPGLEHRETLRSAAEAAAAGGVTTIVCMPETEPVIDDPALVEFVLARARETSRVRVHTMGALTRGLRGLELAEIGLMAEAGALAFSNGRRSVAGAGVMRRALTYARDFEALVEHVPQDPALVGDGVMHEGEMASRLGLLGIPPVAETVMLERDTRLAEASGARLHAALLSSGQSVEILERAKARGARVTAGVSINNLSLNEYDVGAYRTFCKLAPPLRGEDDRRALVEALARGVVDVLVSAHDPQDVDTKRHPFAEAADGAVGLETLLAAGLRLVHDGSLSLLRLIEASALAPARLLGLPAGRLQPGSPADLVVFDPDEIWQLDAAALRSRAKNTPFDGARFSGRVLATYIAGRQVYGYAEAS